MFFEQKDVNFAAYADHNTRYCFDKNLEVLHSKFQICALKPLEWFSNNYMQMNSDKWHLILVLMMKVSKQKIRLSTNHKSKNFSMFILIMNYSLIHTLKLYVERWEKSSGLFPSYNVHVYKSSTTINEKFYNASIQLLPTHLDVSQQKS